MNNFFRVGFIMPAYNAEKTISKTVERIPWSDFFYQKIIPKLYIINDGSNDSTLDMATKLQGKRPSSIIIISHPKNLGYGAAQKSGLFKSQADLNHFHLILHADGQYAPEEIFLLLTPLRQGIAQVVIGSKFKKGAVIRQGMPVLRMFGIRFFDLLENIFFGAKGLEFHSGSMAYSSLALQNISYQKLTNSYHFDGEMVFRCIISELRIEKVAISTCYGRERSSLKAFPYLREVLHFLWNNRVYFRFLKKHPPKICWTRTVCHQCHLVIPAKLFEKNGDIFMEKHCPHHGQLAEVLFWKNANLFWTIKKQYPTTLEESCRTLKCLQRQSCLQHINRCYNILFDITSKCNLKCPVCFANTDDRVEMSLQQLKQLLPNATNKRSNPHVILIGGEPTLHPQLKQMIALIVSKSLIPRLITNGIALQDRVLVAELKAAGLDWVCLQFDGISSAASIAQRQLDLTAVKASALKNLQDFQFKIQLLSHLTKGVNLQEVMSIIRLMFSHRSIFWLSIYPNSKINKNDPIHTRTFTSDIIEAIHEQSGGLIAQSDFIFLSFIFKWLFFLTQKSVFRIKLHYLPLLLVKSGDQIIPVTRLLFPRNWPSNFLTMLKLVRDLSKLFHFDRSPVAFPDYLKVIVISKFMDEDAVDIDDETKTHQAYAVPGGLVPFDFYNIFYRNRIVPHTNEAPIPQ